MTGIDAQAADSYKKGDPVSCCNFNNSGRCSAIIFLLALTTALPLFNAVETISKAGPDSLITSTITLISGSFKIESRSVVNRAAGASLFLAGFLMHTLLIDAFREGVCCNTLYKPSPTTPNPNSPMVSCLCVSIDFFYCFCYFQFSVRSYRSNRAQISEIYRK